MKRALVIHPVISYYAGGEFLCLNVCEALQTMGYKVTLACDVFEPASLEKIYGLGKVMQDCEHIPIPRFIPKVPHFIVLQRLDYARHLWPMFKNFDADVIFSTQSSPFHLTGTVFHFVYDASDPYGHPRAASPFDFPYVGNGPPRLYFEVLKRTRGLLWRRRVSSRDWFFAVGSYVLRDLRQAGYRNSSLAFPPCRVNFKPDPNKKKQIVQAARIIPEKRLESFFQIASRLSEYEFFLIGRDTSELKRSYPGYSDLLLSKIPKNVTYVNGLVGDRRDLFEESMIYLHTGRDRGIGLAMVEAMAAGCIPFSPRDAGAIDIVSASGVGVLFDSVDEAVLKLRMSLEQNLTEDELFDISRRAQRFSPEVFKKWVGGVVESGPK